MTVYYHICHGKTTVPGQKLDAPRDYGYNIPAIRRRDRTTPEELKRIMKRILIILLATALMLLCSIAALAETPELATPTDLEPAEPSCAHEHTETTLYFPSPKYTSISGSQHRVSGKATAVTVCRDCGETLSIEERDWAEEIRFHTYRNGACFLCGAPQPDSAGETASAATAAPESGGFWAAFDETLTNVTEIGNMFLFGCAGSARCCR